MARRSKAKSSLRGKARLRSEIVEAMQGLRKIGAVGEGELEKTTLRMLGRDALPKVTRLSPTEIVKVREKAGVSEAALAGRLTVAAQTVSQGERGEQRPTGASAKAAARRQDQGA